MGKILKTVKPHTDFRPTTDFAAKDILFNWVPFDLPKGGAVELKSISYVMPGEDAVGHNGALDFQLLFAKPNDKGEAPTTLGKSSAVISAITSSLIRPFLIGSLHLDASELEDADDTLLGYNMCSTAGYSKAATADIQTAFSPLILEGDHYAGGTIQSLTYPATTEGNQTIFVAGIAIDAGFNFGTGVLLNQVGNQATSTTAVGLVTDGTDADDIFVVGDIVGTGAEYTEIGTVTAVAANTLTVDKVDNAFNNNDEIYKKHPIVFNFGFEY